MVISDSFKKELFFEMLRIRGVEEKIVGEYSKQEMRCPVHLCIGQEATAVGVCKALSKSDYVFGNHRSHGHYLAKGGSLKALIAEFYGKKTGCSKGIGGSMHIVDKGSGFMGSTSILSSSIPIAVGTALAAQIKNNKKVTVVFFGDGATEEGVFYESINFASLKQLPVIFVCENNFYSVYSPLSVRQPKKKDLCQVVKSFGIESLHADGNNVLQVYNLAEHAVQKARNNLGPTFLEFDTYRIREHCGPYVDDDLNYRPTLEVDYWKKRCPLCLFKKELIGKYDLTERDVNLMLKRIDDEIEEAFAFAKSSAVPDHSYLTEKIYACEYNNGE